jgi:hypothetical protein
MARISMVELPTSNSMPDDADSEPVTIGPPMSQMRVMRQIATWFWLARKRLLPVGLLLTAVWAILEFSNDRPVGGIFALVFGVYFLFSYFRARRQRATDPSGSGWF